MADLAVTAPTTGSAERVDARRSTRIFQSVPLSVSGMNALGNPFLEMTSAVSFNCHGCLYRSRYHNRPGSWVTLHMPNTATGKAQPVRAQVRFVRLPGSPKELYQVGVELENPSNVWGIQAPPEDWMSFLGTVTDAPAVEKSAGPQLVSESAALEQDLAAKPGTIAAEGTVTTGAGKPVRVVVSSDQLMQKLESKLQAAAERAVDAVMSARFSTVVNQAAKAIDDFSQSSVRKVQKQVDQYREQMVTSAREQFLSRVQEDLAAAEERLERRVELLLARTEEAGKRWEASMAQAEPALAEAESSLQKAALRAQYDFAARAGEIANRTQAQVSERTALLGEQQIVRVNEQTQNTLSAASKQLQAKTDETRALLQTKAEETRTQLQARLDETRAQLIEAAGTSLAELHSAAENEVDRAVDDSRQKVEAAVAGFCERANASWDTRFRACQDELANTSQREVEEFRAKLLGILSSTMIAATTAVSDNAKALLNVLTKDTAPTAQGAGRDASSEDASEPSASAA